MANLSGWWPLCIFSARRFCRKYRISDTEEVESEANLLTWEALRRYDAGRQALIKQQLERLVATKGCSKDAFEIVSRSLKG